MKKSGNMSIKQSREVYFQMDGRERYGGSCCEAKLKAFFEDYPRVVVACSGGIDSTFLLCEAKKYASDVLAVLVHTAFQPEFELQDAQLFCKYAGIELKIIQYDVLQHEEVVLNPPNRCYLCKRAIFGTIIRETESFPHDAVIDGTNADDDENDRPGMRALKELGVLSPLRTCGFTKSMIREAAKMAGIAIWNKPAFACLATRIAQGERITEHNLKATAHAEDYMMHLGFSDFRVRRKGNTAKIQILAKDFSRFIENRKAILKELSNDYDSVTLDLKARDDE